MRWPTLVVSCAFAASTGCEPKVARPLPVSRAEASAPLPDAPQEAPTTPPTTIRLTPKTVRFAWRPPGADEASYAMDDAADQHRLVLIGRAPDDSYPVLVAMHGQPKRAQNPRDYVFPQTVIDVATRLVQQGEVRPLAIALPVFRFRGVDWPQFDLVAFRAKIEQVLANEAARAGDFYVVGHSGAAGCGGDGMNRAHRIRPAAVGFFDTCLGQGWRDEINALARDRVPTTILQSVETAGVQPRHLREYDGRYDFGPVFQRIDLSPVACPLQLPGAPLREQPYRCAATSDALVRAFVVDTGQGEEAHNALVAVALAFFLRTHLGAQPRP